MEVLRSISGNTSGMPVRAISANEVWLPKWSSMLSAYTFAPYRSAANLLAMLASVLSSITLRTPEAVDEAELVLRPGRYSAM